MTSLAAKLKRKLDQEKGLSEEASNSHEDQRKEESSRDKVPKCDSKASQVDADSEDELKLVEKVPLEEWKKEKDRMREQALEEDKKHIDRTMPEEVRDFQQLCNLWSRIRRIYERPSSEK